MSQTQTGSLANRGRTAFKLGALVLLGCTLLFYITGCLCGMNAGYGKKLWNLSDDKWEFTECLYFSAITLTTIGYTDLLGTEQCAVYRDDAGRFRWESNTDAHQQEGYDATSEKLFTDFTAWTRTLTTLVAIIGMSFFLYVIAQVTSFFVEGQYQEISTAKRAQKKIRRFTDHMILCGGGRNGCTVLEQAQKEGVDCVVIDRDSEVIRDLRQTYPSAACIRQDAMDVEALETAGIDRARGVVTAMPDDRANLVATVTARQLSTSVRIVSRCVNNQSQRQLRYAGANSVVNTVKLTGMRIASELIRPTVVNFLAIILGHNDTQDMVISGICLQQKDDGRTLGSLPLDQVQGVEIVAYRRGEIYTFNPAIDALLLAEDELVMLGSRELISQLAKAIADEPACPAHETALEQTPEALLPAEPEPATQAEPDDTELQGHFIICGAGKVGQIIAEELASTRRNCVCIDTDPDALNEFRNALPNVRVIEAEPYSPDALEKANICSARALTTILTSDRDNLVVIVTALQANPSIRALSTAADETYHSRLRRAGAETVYPAKIGGRRMASELLRPTATTVLDRMLAASGTARFEAVIVNRNAELAGMSLAKADLFTRTGLRVLAVSEPDREQYNIKPAPETTLTPGTILIVSGPAADISKLVALAGDWA
ncbi:MAG TPA: NAD-binding protein [Verrucomicrobiota bacterium]|nr:NAD-binding protein [Verrucomicrobiota bacterium]